MIYLLFNFLLTQWKFQYTNYKYIIVSFLSSIIGVSVFWFTSQAIQLPADISALWLNQDYFTYLLIGELALMLPLSLVESPARTIYYLNQERMLEYFLTRSNSWGPLSQMALARSLISLLNSAFIILIAKFIFNWSADVSLILQIVFLSILATPLFLGLGIIFGTIILYYKRGYSLISEFNYLCAIFAGAYFPTAVFTERWSAALKNISPYNMLLENLRQHSAGMKINFTSLFLYFDVIGILILILGLLFLNKIFRLLRKSGHMESAHLGAN